VVLVGLSSFAALLAFLAVSPFDFFAILSELTSCVLGSGFGPFSSVGFGVFDFLTATGAASSVAEKQCQYLQYMEYGV
jgi:hypothetical protein